MIALVGDTNPYVKLLRANLGQQLGKRAILVEVSETTLTDELSARGVVWFPIDCVLAVSVKADRGGSALSWFADCGLGVITDIANTNAVCCSAHSFKQRLARVLIEAHQVFPALEPLTLTQKRIGTFLLTRRETVALLIEEWRREGILATFRGAIVVNDMERLRNESCACYQRVALARQRLLASWSSILLRSRGPSANPHAIDVRVSPPTLKATAVSTQG
ncbi:MAG: helix-turn-helix domain-containing protein [Gammaproteobacteria bacterium]|nr:helix-turn-helix domain-containing protein [Gammaproteobacteria bacterium]